MNEASILGRVLAGTYRLEAEIGRGAMGIVYRARNEVLDQDVAVKVLSPELAGDEHVRSRLLQEARALTLLSHRGIVPVRHCGEEDGLLFVVMGLCPGETLADLLLREGTLPEARALEIVRQVLEALREAHRAGIVHRDLKPENVMIEQVPQEDGTTRDHARVLDFGLARVVGTARANLPGALVTTDGLVVGTVAYMSPEQVRAEGDVDARSDLFSAGVLLYEMLAGRRPFESDSALSVMMRILEAPPPALPEDAPGGVSRSTRAIVMRALMKDREDRFQHAADFLLALEGHLDPRLASRRMRGGLPGAARSTGTPRARRRRLLLAGLGLLGVVAAAVVLLATRRTPDPRALAQAAAARCEPGAVLAHLADLARAGPLRGEDHLLAADAHIALRDPAAAADLDEAARLLGRADPRVRVARGRYAWWVAGDVEAARKAFADAVVRDATGVEALAWRLRMLLDREAGAQLARRGVDPLGAAEKDLASMRRRRPDDPRVALFEGMLAFLWAADQAGAAADTSTEQALASLARAEAEDPRAAEPPWQAAVVHNLRAQMANQAGRYEDMHAERRSALAAFDRAVARIQADPAYRCQGSHETEIRRARSFTRLSEGDDEGAMADIRAVYAEGQDLAAYFAMGETLRLSGHLDEAIALYHRLIEATSDSRASFYLAYCHERRAFVRRAAGRRAEALEDYGLALGALTQAVAGRGDPALVRAYRGEVHLRRAELDPAARAAEIEAARADFEASDAGWRATGSRIELDHRYAELLCYVGEVDRARTRLERSIGGRQDLTAAIYGRYARVLVCAAAKASAGGDGTRARAWLDRAVDMGERTRKISPAPKVGAHLVVGTVALARGLLAQAAPGRDARFEAARAAFAEAATELGETGSPDLRRALRLAALEIAGYLRGAFPAVAAARRTAWAAGHLQTPRAVYEALARALAEDPARAADAEAARAAARAALR